MKVDVLPSILVTLIERGAWRQPPDELWDCAIPWLAVPDGKLDLHIALDPVEDGHDAFVHDLRRPKRSKVCSSAVAAEHRDDDDWLDADRALLIAVNRTHGSDLGVALDYRTDAEDPRVVASCWKTGDHSWRRVDVSLRGFLVRVGFDVHLIIGSTSFSNWLEGQVRRRDSIGDLARRAIDDEAWPRLALTFGDFQDRLEGSRPMRTTLLDAWLRYASDMHVDS